MPDRLNPDERLDLDQFITSSDRRFRLIMQKDGNLVLYRERDSHSLWASGTFGKGGTHAIMQRDGNLVINAPSGPLWASGTWNHPGAYLMLQDDGNLVIYDPKPIWDTKTYEPQSGPTKQKWCVTVHSSVSGGVIARETIEASDAVEAHYQARRVWEKYSPGGLGSYSLREGAC